MEIWKDAFGYDGLYQVSSLGNVRSLDRSIKTSNKYGECIKRYRGKNIKKSLNSNGYYRISTVGIREYIHILVAKTFIPNPIDKPQVNHKDGNKINNAVSNLEWTTSAENVIHSRATGLNITPIGIDHWSYRGKSTHAKITCDLQTGIFFDCLKDAIEATATQVTDSAVVHQMKKHKSRFVYV